MIRKRLFRRQPLLWQLPLLGLLCGILIWQLWPHIYFYTNPDYRLARVCRNDISCVNEGLRAIVESKNPREALRVAGQLTQVERLAIQGHTFAHEIGYATAKKYSTLRDQIQACDDSLGSGCYHGVMMLFISQPKNARADLSATCTPFAGQKPHAMYTDCVHGIGHGLMMQALMLKGAGGGWNEIDAALKGCRRISTRDSTEYKYCSGGVFMEYRVAATLNTFHYPNPPAYSMSDIHWPCSKVKGVARVSCYSYQGSLITQRVPSIDAAFNICAEALGEAAKQCAANIGRDRITGKLNLDKKTTSAICGAAAQPGLREACFLDSAQYYLYLNRNVNGALQMCRLSGVADEHACEKFIRDFAKQEYDLAV